MGHVFWHYCAKIGPQILALKIQTTAVTICDGKTIARWSQRLR